MLAMWRPVLVYLLAFGILAGLVGWRLGTLTPGVSEVELSTYHSSNGLSLIVENAVNGPYKFAVYLFTRVMDNALGLRLTGAIVGGASIVLFYLMASRILTGFNAGVTTVMFATTTMFLQTARHASPNVMLLSLLALFAVGALIRFGRRVEISWMVASAVIALSLYTPVMVYFVIAGALWQFRRVRNSFEELPSRTIIICAAIFSVLATPLAVSLIREPSLYKELLGIPNVWPTLEEAGLNIARAILSLFVVSPYNPTYWLGRQPILDIFATALFIYGISSLFRSFRLDRFMALLGIAVLTFAWIAITGNLQAIIMLLPFIYIILGLGLQNLTGKWLKVFPRNPIARSTAFMLMSVAIALSVNFQLQRYFVAWPNAPATKEAYSHQLP